jgi:hypothetical protein
VSENTMEWVYPKAGAKEEDIQAFLSKITYTLPQPFIDLMKVCDGGMPIISAFKYEDNHFGEIECDLGSFLSFERRIDGLWRLFTDPPEFFPEGILAFAVTGNGDYICFDYRTNPTSNNPPVVYWSHEASTEESISFIAKTFDDFMDMLYEDEDDE